jgi:4-alpha-glucanotransferase
MHMNHSSPRTAASPGRRRPRTIQRSAHRAGNLRRRQDIQSGFQRAEAARTRSASDLRELAQAHGIQLFYVDMAGHSHQTSAETLKAILQLRGVAAGNARQIRDSLREEAQRRAREVLPPVIVAWAGKGVKISLRLPGDLQPYEVYCKVRFEDGRAKAIFPAFGPSPSVPPGRRQFALTLPSLPFGYHELEVEFRNRTHNALVISSPVQTYSPPPGRRDWGVFLPVYALHSERSWGAGNFGDWEALFKWTCALGGKVMASLPLLAAFLEEPFCEPSPYAPASRLFWNEFFLDIERIPEFSVCAPARELVRSSSFERRLNCFRHDELIDYRGQMALRRQVLERLAACFFATESPRRQEFGNYLEHRPVLRDYAEFRAACEQTRLPWPRWEERMRNGKLQSGDYWETARDYHLYVQWLAQQQISGLLSACRSYELKLYLDLPLGVHPSGYDVWRERDIFAVSASVGAPPDLVFTQGQNWGFTPLDPQRIRERRYRYLIEYVRFQMRHTGLLRIDHIMGLHRLFWIPPGFSPDQGAYVSYPADELLAILALESHRHRTVMVGENLGTVPPEVNEAMKRHQVRQMYVVQYEQRPDLRQSLRYPPIRAVASLNTHDMPPFAGHWSGKDVVDRSTVGLIPKNQVTSQKHQRHQSNVSLERFLRRQRLLNSEQPASARTVLRACLKWLAASPAEMLLINLEDLWEEDRPQNLPGTSCERPNWCRKSRLSLDQILKSEELRQFLEMLHQLRRPLQKPGP